MKILVTGGTGFLGKSLTSLLSKYGMDFVSIGSKEADLTSYPITYDMLNYYKPDVVVHLAASVGGIGANRDNPGSFFYRNIIMGLNIIESCRLLNIKKIVQIGTVCSYPKFTNVPFKEEDLWVGYPEETNAPYGIAKKSLLVMLKAYREQYGLNSISLLPSNLYGPNDNFDDRSSHVIPALIKKFVVAKQENHKDVVVWGTGAATREFLYVDDASEAIVKSLSVNSNEEAINLGGGGEISIRDLAEKIGALVGFEGNIMWDVSKPDGQPRRCLNSSKAYSVLNWRPLVSFDEGLKRTIDWYVSRA
jgi:GDP-L-fucose synthase